MKAEQGFSSTVLPPYYEKDDSTNLYYEIKTPSTALYKEVGYNTQEVIKKIEEGERKLGQDQPERKSTVVKKNKNSIKDLEDQNYRLEKTNKHYRRYYNDELENDKELFPKEPFNKFNLIRGQSRGLQKSWFSFFTPDKTDEDG